MICAIYKRNPPNPPRKEMYPMVIYAIVVTVLVIMFAILTLKWKISTLSITMFCIENFREPTDKEIADCTKRTVSKMFKLD